MGAITDPVTGDAVGRQAIYAEDASGNPVRVTSTSPLPVTSGAPAAANILNGFLSFAATTGATTLITIPAGRTWKGEIGVSCAAAVAAASTVAGQARGVVAVAGTNVVPAAGTIMAVEAKAGANAATGTVGAQAANEGSMKAVVVAPAGNAVTVTVATTQAGTSSVVDAWASGELV